MLFDPRNRKRRRKSYKTNTSKGSYRDVLRDLIQIQMDLLKDILYTSNDHDRQNSKTEFHDNNNKKTKSSLKEYKAKKE